MRISKLVVRNFMGIASRTIAVPPAGFIAAGECGLGKSSILAAVRLALAGQKIAPHAIRNGADEAEVYIDVDDVSVTSATSRKRATVMVERGGMEASKPVTFLRELLGSSSIDAMSIMLEKPKERRAMILAALPVSVTLAQLQKYAPDIDPAFDVSDHGLEVVARAHKFFYDERTEANKEVKEAEATAKRLTNEAQALSAALPHGPMVPSENARAAVVEAERALQALENRKTEATSATERTTTQRQTIATLREDAGRAERDARAPIELAPLKADVAQAEQVVRELETKLTAARAALSAVEAYLAKGEKENAWNAQCQASAAGLRGQADALEAALAAATVTAPSEGELTASAAALTAARATLDRGALQATALAAVKAAEVATATFRSLEAEAAELDQTVKRLANEAPAELLAAADGIPGLTLDGDELVLDGVRLNDICGKEQMNFAIEVARRANAKSKILICDGMERLDRKSMEHFVRRATAGGYQLLGTAVADGELEIRAIEIEAEAQAAE